jgi:hypothetical protein
MLTLFALMNDLKKTLKDYLKKNGLLEKLDSIKTQFCVRKFALSLMAEHPYSTNMDMKYSSTRESFTLQMRKQSRNSIGAETK